MPDEITPEKFTGERKRWSLAPSVRGHDVSALIRISTTTRGRTRLLELMAGGETEVVVTAVDGSMSVRASIAHADRIEFAYGNLSVDWSGGLISSPTARVSLSRTELRLLGALLEGKGRPVSFEQLIQCAWPEAVALVSQSVLKTYIHSLRQRLATIGAASALVTVRGVGYRLSS